MKKEEILSLVLTEKERQRVEAIYTANEKFKKGTCILDSVKGEKELHSLLEALIVKYENKKKTKKTKKIGDELSLEIREAITDGFTESGLVDLIKEARKTKHNSEIEAQIALLRKQLI